MLIVDKIIIDNFQVGRTMEYKVTYMAIADYPDEDKNTISNAASRGTM